MSDYLSPKTYSLKPYQSKEKGRERIMTGALLFGFALFNFYLAAEDGFLSLLFGVFFGWSGLKNISLGLRLRQLPSRDRAYRVTPSALFKVLEGKDLARLAFSDVKAIWLDDGQAKLSLMTQRGVEELTKDEFQVEQDWERFTHQVERSLTTLIYRSDPAAWQSVQQQSQSMAELSARKPLGVRSIALSLTCGAILFFYFLQSHLPYLVQTGRSELLYILLGAPSLDLINGLTWSSLFTGLLLPVSGISLIFDLFALFWVGRPLERAWGTLPFLVLYLGGYFVGLLPGLLGLDLAPPLYIGATGGSIALFTAAFALRQNDQKSFPPQLKRARTSAIILGFVFIFVISFELRMFGLASTGWIASAVFGSLLAKYFIQLSTAQASWTLGGSPLRARLYAGLTSLCFIVSVFGSLTGQSHLSEITTAEQLSGTFTPSALIERSQQCSGAPLSSLGFLPPDVDELLPPVKRCSASERRLLRRSLGSLSGFFPLEQTGESSGAQSPKQYLDLAPPLARAQALDLFRADLTPNTIAGELGLIALDAPLDLYGNLLASLIDSQLSPLTPDQDKESDVSSHLVQTRQGEVSLHLKEGQLSWDIVRPLDGQASQPELHWFAVLNQTGKMSKLLVIEIPSKTPSSDDDQPLNQERIGSSTVAKYLVPLNANWPDLKELSARHRDDTRPHLYHWRPNEQMTEWVKSALKD